MDEPQVQRARTLVLKYGWNTTSYQVLNPNISYWFSTTDEAVIGYVENHRVRVVAGAPICAAQRLADVVAEFERASEAAGCSVCYFCAESRMDALLTNSPSHSKVLLGAQPAWRLSQWPLIFGQRPSLKAQLNRARNKSVKIKEWSIDDQSRRPALYRCLNEWLESKPFPTLHFLVEPMTLDRLYDRRIFVAERNGEVQGFVVASPIPLRHGWLIEQIIRGASAVNGVSELMIDSAVRALSESGGEFMTLGLSPLSQRAEIEASPNPLWLGLLLRWVRAHGRRFYNFDGLDSFKSKFQPDHWEPIYAISNQPRFSPLTLYAIAAAFTQNSPVHAVSQAMLKAIQTEIGWLKGRTPSG
jgi:phosphatidylglycerol lysyltransferase